MRVAQMAAQWAALTELELVVKKVSVKVEGLVDTRESC